MCKPFDPEQLRSLLTSFLKRSLVRSLSAKLEGERAIQNELQRKLAYARTRVEAVSQLKASTGERMARARAYEAFVEARGTRAHFDSWWPHMFSGARAVFQQHHANEDA